MSNFFLGSIRLIIMVIGIVYTILTSLSVPVIVIIASGSALMGYGLHEWQQKGML